VISLNKLLFEATNSLLCTQCAWNT